MHLILASQSPRRKEILEKLNMPFEVIPSTFEEDMTQDITPSELVQILAEGKATQVAKDYPEAVVIGSDTLVSFQGRVLGKPSSTAEATTMLQSLQGQENQVLTGLCIMQYATGFKQSLVETTTVQMACMTEEEISSYVSSGEPMDKAGAYALQGYGAVFIEKIEGDFFSAMGLPLRRVYQVLNILFKSI